MSIRRTAAWTGVVVICLGLCAYLTRVTWLEAMGHYLVDTQPLERADMIVVLGGDWNGNRILKAAELAKQGYAPHVLVSGTGYLYGPVRRRPRDSFRGEPRI